MRRKLLGETGQSAKTILVEDNQTKRSREEGGGGGGGEKIDRAEHSVATLGRLEVGEQLLAQDIRWGKDAIPSLSASMLSFLPPLLNRGNGMSAPSWLTAKRQGQSCLPCRCVGHGRLYQT